MACVDPPDNAAPCFFPVVRKLEHMTQVSVEGITKANALKVLRKAIEWHQMVRPYLNGPNAPEAWGEVDRALMAIMTAAVETAAKGVIGPKDL